ncbi:transporter substrate-binding domain-containing protein [Microbacterium sp. zg-YB36]|uniref:transporter substrate-binding domain-containing protein n=1 Tax=Microbacterium sp. zg-YB36 TaxID=2969407 RepID=UPI00214CC95E|nr:transporter substrate-binding domain-containing protein [Microbacterium sp. zg-YB36]MDL5351107.1 transporter substrate-binding domain-containing protein [Microbacterium sp. zg-YB36]
MPTPTHNLPYYDDTDTAALDALLNGQSDAIELALNNLAKKFPQPVADEGARNDLFPSPVHGNAVFREDLGYVERYYNNTSVFPTTGWMRDGGDTGWQTVTPSGTGFTPYGTGIIFRRIGNVVHFNVSATNGSWGAGNWSIAPIPSGYRPTKVMTFTSSYNDVAKEVQFTPAGSVVVAKSGSGGITVSGEYPVG